MQLPLSSLRFALLFMFMTLIGLLAIGTVNWWIDPYQHYREATRYAARFYNAQQRFVNPGLVKHADYNRIVMGSSLMENVDTVDVDRAFSTPTAMSKSINISMSAMTAFDANQLLTLAIATGKVKHVIINLDYNAFSGAPDRSGFNSQFPQYLYDQTSLNDAPYLLGIDTLKKSTEIIRKAHTSRFSESRTRPWFWAEGADFSAAKTVRNLDPQNINKQFKQPNRTLVEMQASFERNIMPLLAMADQSVKFSFVYLPYSSLVWADFQQRKQVDVTLQFRQYAFLRTASFSNATWYDFQADAALVNDLSHYTDIYHFSPAISKRVIEAIARDEYRLDAEKLEYNDNWLKSLATAINAAAVINSAKN